jgi:guanylate kinase
LISGPSGVGKTTVIEQMLSSYFPKLQPVVTTTTRRIGTGECEGKQYYFLSPEEFRAKEKAGEFLETIERHKAKYGTLRREIRDKMKGAHDLIMHIDWKGKRELEALSKREKWIRESIISVFILPKSLSALRQRLQRRGRNTPTEIRFRLREARADLRHAREYDYAFISGSYEQDLNCIKAIYLAESLRARRA